MRMLVKALFRSTGLVGIFFVLSFSQTACVKKAVYEKAMVDLDTARLEGLSCSQSLEACTTKASALEQQYQDQSQTLAKAQARVTDLEAELKTANGELGRLKKMSTEESEAANKEMSRMQEIVGSLHSNLDEARKAVTEMRSRNEAQEARLVMYQDLLDRFKKLIASGQLDVQLSRGRMVVKLAEGILFASGSADLRADGQAVLAEVGTVLSSIPNRNFQIEGHTDNVPIRGSKRFPTNWELSTARASEVVKYLISQGMDPLRLSAAGYAEFAPVVPNDSAEHRALNRRIEIVLLPNLDELPFKDLEATSKTR